MRFERTASSLGGKRSVLLSYEDVERSSTRHASVGTDARSWNRTSDLPYLPYGALAPELFGLEQGLTSPWEDGLVSHPFHSSPAKAPFTSGDGVLIGSTTPQA